MKFYSINRDDFESLNKKKKHELHFYSSPESEELVFSSHTYETLLGRGELLSVLKAAEEKIISPSDYKGFLERILQTTSSVIQERVPKNILPEIVLILRQNPNLLIEFLGRGSNESILPLEVAVRNFSSFSFDIFTMRRKYFWKCFPKKARLEHRFPQNEFSGLSDWFQEDFSKVVICLGGGGKRVYSAPTILKIIDSLNLRSSIDEIWGASAGSIVGGLYANGVSPYEIETSGFDFYNDRFPDFALSKSKWKKFLNISKNFKSQIQDISNPTLGVVKAKEVLQNLANRLEIFRDKELQQIPYFALASNPSSKHLQALCEKQYIPDYLKEYLLEADWKQGMCASSALPFIIPPENIGASSYKNLFVDGSITEEVPLILPFIKFMKEREHEKIYPYKKLKIFYVNLNTRFEEWPYLEKFENFEGTMGKIAWAGKIWDKLMNDNFTKTIQVLNYHPDVDVLGVTLKVNKLGFLNPEEIPHIISAGRKNFYHQLLEIEKKLKAQNYNEEKLAA